MKNTFLTVILLVISIPIVYSQKSYTTDLEFFFEHYPTIKKMRFDELRENKLTATYILKNKEGFDAEYSRIYFRGGSKMRFDYFILTTDTKKYTLSVYDESDANFKIEQLLKETGRWKELYNIDREATGFPYKIRFMMLVQSGGLSLYR